MIDFETRGVMDGLTNDDKAATDDCDGQKSNRFNGGVSS